jgi:UDP-N-acetylglucosamine--N-acetylmuramyl-(pentapeptide) pyrophosphoryl-undecaprenol N-acetylglucosamine transferase
VLQAFPGSFSPGIKAETVGNPVRADISALDEPQSRYAGREGPLHLLILGGSQGALALNKVVPAALALLPDDLQPVVRHQAGERTIAEAKAAYEAHNIEVELQPFIEDMAEAYAWADLVVCRAGALTVAEISAAGLPAIFVPFPSAVDDHQTANARPMTVAGAAALMPETDLSDESLASLLRHWLASRDALLQRAMKSRALAHPDALQRITNYCLEAAGATP